MSCIGLASGLGAGNPGCGKGPLVLQEKLGLPCEEMILPETSLDKITTILEANRLLSKSAYRLAKKEHSLLSLGGDHSCAIGFWSGVAAALRSNGPIGMIWIDAHMDAHTFETSPSKNIHGMPLATLLGTGDPRFTSLGDSYAKLLPQNLVLIGIRSYEPEEARFLESLNVRIYFMDEVREKGIKSVLKEAQEHVLKNSIGYGVSFDLDSIDPSSINAVGTPAEHGLDPDEFLQAIPLLQERPPLAFEMVEYNPFLDPNEASLRYVEKVLDPFLTQIAACQ